MILTAYSAALRLVAPVAIPWLVWRSLRRGHAFRALAERFGFAPALLHQTRPGAVWLHAVSVGEALAAEPLLRALRGRFPERAVLVSAGTATGLKTAREKLSRWADGFFYIPWDLPGAARRALNRLKPALVIVLETEIWPNLYRETKRRGAGLMLVNGRISDRSLPRYLRFRRLFQAALDLPDAVLAQSEQDAERFRAIGAPVYSVECIGNLKYDFQVSSSTVPDVLDELLKRLRPECVVVAGSTREGEEALIADAFQTIARRRPKALLLVAPRHPQRFDEAFKALTGRGLPVLRRSQMPGDLTLPGVVLVDTLGELASLYALGDVVFVGGSLNGWGGHNVLEPALAGKPVVVGPTMQNFREITERLLAGDALVQVADAFGLGAALEDLLDHPDKAAAIGARGRAIAEAERGAADRAVERAAGLLAEARPIRPPSPAREVALAPLGWAWRAGAAAHRGLYERGWKPRATLPRPVISVGNLDVGGSGKTPTVAWLTERLALRGRRAAVLTRGYRRRGRRDVVVGPDEAADPRRAGDEAALLHRRFERSGRPTPIGVGGDRARVGRALLERFDADLFVLDDGFQHHRLARDLDLVLIDAARPLDFERPLPVGRLREPPPALASADAFLLTRAAPRGEYARQRRKLGEIRPGAPIFSSRMRPTRLFEPRFEIEREPSALDGVAVHAFCGIGSPESFRAALEDLGARLVGFQAFRDHHRYSLDDWWRIAADARKSGAAMVVTTEKDLVNLASEAPVEMRTGSPPLQVLEIELEVDREVEFLDWIEARLDAAAK